MGAAEWIALAGVVLTLAVSIFSAGVAFGRIRAVASDVTALADDIAALKAWKEEARVNLADNFVKKTELREAINAAIAPVRRTAEQTHEIVTRIASRLHIPAVEGGE